MGDFIEQEGLLPENHQNTNFVDVCEICGVKRSNFKNSLLYLEHYKKFNSIWKRYKVNNLEDPQHGENLLAAVEDFNSCNI